MKTFELFKVISQEIAISTTFVWQVTMLSYFNTHYIFIINFEEENEMTEVNR